MSENNNEIEQEVVAVVDYDDRAAEPQAVALVVEHAAVAHAADAGAHTDDKGSGGGGHDAPHLEAFRYSTCPASLSRVSVLV